MMNFAPPNETERRLVMGQMKMTEDELEETTIGLKEWLKTQRHLPQNIDDHFLQTFALFNGKGIENTRRRLDAFFSIRGMLTTIYDNWDPSSDEWLKSSRCVGLGVCPGYTEDMCRVFVGKFIDTDPISFNCIDLARRMMFLLDLSLHRDFKSGVYFLSDLKGMSARHLLKVSPTVYRDLLFSLQNAYPVIIRRIIFFNVNTYCKAFLNTVVVPFLKKKIAKRTHILSDDDGELQKLVPPALLPSDMGGDGPSTIEINDFWTNTMASERNWAITDAKAKSDERMRDGDNPLKMPNCSVM